MTHDDGTTGDAAEALRILERLLDAHAGERPALLDELSAGRPALRARVESLLAWDAREHHLLDGGVESLESALLDDAGSTPDAIAGYRILRELGRGGMGVVYLAERSNVDFHQLVALKLIGAHPDAAALADRLRRERRILAGLRHPNIAQLFDGGITEAGRPFLVMEYIEGERIDRWCDARGLDIDARVRLFLSVCAAVEHVQDRFVVHRDLKPANLLVTDDGVVKLLDFGIAKPVAPNERSARDPRTALVAFTPGYASPEQLRNLDASPATDVYALGVILYELLAGAAPFAPRDDPFEAVRAVIETDPPPPSRHRRALRGDLDAIVLKAMQRRPEDRYPDARSLREDLERFLALKPVSARRTTYAYRARMFGRRHRTVLAVALAAVVLAGAGSGLAVAGAGEPQSIVAYDHVLRGDILLAARTPDDVRRAIAQYRAAAEAAPRSARPLFREAYAWLVYAEWGWEHPRLDAPAMLNRAATLIDLGLAIGGRAPDGLLALGYLRVLRDPQRFEGAVEAFEQSLALDSANVEAWHQYGQAVMALGRFDDAERAYREALRLEPRRAMTLVPLSAMALYAGRLDEALAWSDSAISVGPANSYARASRARILIAAHDTAAARAEAELAAGVDQGHATPVRATLVAAYAASGDLERARAVYAALPHRSDATPLSPTDASSLSAAALAAGDTAAALGMLARAQPRGAWLRFYLRAPQFDGIRDRTAFRAISEPPSPS